MPEPRRQFRILYRDFLRRIIDLEALSPQGGVEKLLGQFAATLAAFNLTYVFFAGPKYLLDKVPAAQLQAAAGQDCEFLIAATMTAAGLFSALAWNTVLPGRQDAVILGLLPVRVRTIFRAKLAALASALGVAVVAVNVFTGFAFPFAALPEGCGWMAALRAFAGYWVGMAAAGLFVGCGMLALEGLAVLLLPYRRFLRVSSFLQLAAFFAILAAFFLRPPGAAPWLPSSWFFGLQQELSGAVPYHPLAATAWLWLCGVCAVAGLSFAFAYARTIRKTVDEPDILPAARRRLWANFGFVPLGGTVDRAIVLFTARTIARSRQHRLLLAAYAGIGLSIACAYGRDLMYGASAPQARKVAAHWNQLNVPLLMAGVVLLCFAVAGTRAIFSLPVALRANWVFQLTAVHAPASYFTAVRKALFAVAVVPVWTVCAAGYFLVWPGQYAAQHMLVLSIVAVLLVHRALNQFRKIPFTCSYLPGNSNLHLKIGVYGLGLIAVSSFAVHVEFAAMRRPSEFALFCAVWLLVALGLWFRWRAFAKAPGNWIEFEELPVACVNVLDLHNPPTGPRPTLPPPDGRGRSIRPRPVLALEGAIEPAPEEAVTRFKQWVAGLRGMRF